MLTNAYHPELQGTGVLDTPAQELPAAHVEQVIAPAREYCSSVKPLQRIGLTEVEGHLEPAGH